MSAITILTETFGSSLNWLAIAIKWLISIGPIVGVGIILFTLILKTVMLPLDAYSKIKTRKNNLKMEKMRPQLEKLQKQYENDQQTYNQKMMELYKKNGYSMLGPCLPMIVTLVIFIIVMSAFSSYSSYQSLRTYEQMAESYNASILAYSASEEEDIAETEWEVTQSGENYIYEITITYDSDDKAIMKQDVYVYSTDDPNLGDSEIEDLVESGEELSLKNETYYVKTDVVLLMIEEDSDEMVCEAAATLTRSSYSSDDEYVLTVIKTIGRTAAAETYYEVKDGFLWVKNIWESDVSYESPVQQLDEVPDYEYSEITFNLTKEKTQANGYFILIILSVGFMFLSQFLISRSNKAQNELQTADGSGKKTQTMMMIIMPLMYGIFAFFYSAAFTLYMITSSIYNIISTLLINYFIDKKFSKEQDKEIQEKYNRRIPGKTQIQTQTKAKSKSKEKQNGGKKVK